MKKLLIILLVSAGLYNAAFSQASLCNGADPFCSGTTYNFPATVNAPDAETGPNYGCLFSQPNPAWYYMQVDQSGPIVIYMHSQPQVDIDFACWGPFTSPTAPCTAQLTANCSSCPNNTSDPNFYPSGNLVDCSYSTSWEETVHVNNAITGQYYLLLITNYSNDPCNIIFDQTNLSDPGHGTTNCGILFNVDYSGPVCPGGTFQLFVDTILGATSYHWTGPNGFDTLVQNPVITGATSAYSGNYICTVTAPTGSNTDTVNVVIYSLPVVTASGVAVCDGNTAILSGAGASTYVWSGNVTNGVPFTPAATATYYVTGTDANGCVDTSSATVTVNPNPVVSFSAPSVCGTTSTDTCISIITYTGTNASGASFFWVFQDAVPYDTSYVEGPHNLYWNDLNPPDTAYYNISLIVTNPTGCSDTTTQQIQILPSNLQPNCCVPPPTNAGLNDSICGTTYQLSGSVNPSSTGLWTLDSMPSGGSVTYLPNAATANAFVTINPVYGVYKFLWTEHTGATCFATDTVYITFVEIPVADAGSDQIGVCGISTVLNANPSVGSGYWYEINGDSLHPTTFTQPSQSFATAQIDTTYGTHEFMWVENNYGCRDTDYVEIIYHEQPQAYAGTDIIACGTITDLSGSPNTETISGFWTASTNGVFYNPSDTSSSVNVTVPPYTSAYNEYFIWHQVNEMCRDSDEVAVYFQPFSGEEMVSAGFDIVTCDTSAQLHGIVQPSGFGSGHWTTFDNVTIDSSLDANTFIRFQPNDSTYECDSSKYVVTMTWTVSNGANCTATDNVKITFYQTPQSNAGFTENKLDFASCEKNIKLTAIPSICATYGSWSLASAPAGCTNPNFTEPNAPGSSVQVSCYGVYEFVWFEQNFFNTQCASHDTVTIEFVEPPNIYAGADQYICGDTVYLDATPSGSSVWQSWSTAPVNWLDTNLQNDPSQITNPDAIAAHFHVPNDSIIFVWGERNESTITLTQGTLQCPSTDSVTVYFFTDQAANELISFADTFQCGNIFPNLVAAPPQEGYGIWVDTTFANTVFSQNTYPDNLHDSAIVSDYGIHHFFWITKNGERPDLTSVCVDSSDVIPIRFIEYPDAEILAPLWAANPVPGSDVKWDTVCGPEYSLSPDTNSPGVYTWRTNPSTGMWFVSNNSTTSIDTFDVIHSNIYNSDIGNPSFYEVYLSIDNSVLPVSPFTHSCIDRDTVRITFARRPSGGILLDTTKWPKCYGGTVPLSAANDQQGKPISFEWGFGGGRLDTTYLNTTTPDNLNDSIYEVSWDTTGGDMTHVVSLRTKNPWKCSSVTDTIVVSEPRPYYPEDSVYHATCHQSNGRIKLFLPDSCASCGYYWNGPVFSGNPILLERGNLDPDDCYDIKLYYISKKDPSHTCNHFFCVPVRDTGQVYAAFSSMITDTTHLTPGDEVVFENQSEGGKTYSWHFGDGGTSTSENPSYIFEKGGSFYVYLMARSKEGCESVSDSIRYQIEKSSELEVPNIFTPNGDGKNDIFQVSGKTLKSFHGIISNRWGKTLYEWDEWRKESGGTKYGWDGKIGNTEAAPGVYYYMIKADGWDDIQYNLKGAFHLEREK